MALQKNHKESNQVNEVAIILALPFQSNFRASYCPNTFSLGINNVEAHHPTEKCNRLLSTLNVGRHIELPCFCSSCRSYFDLRRSMGQSAFLLKFHTRSWRSDYVKMSVAPQLGVLYPQILTFCVFTDPFKRKMHSSEKTIFDKHSDIPSCWFWQWSAKITLFLLPVLVIPWRFRILYGYENKHFRKTRCILDRGIFSRDSAYLILRREFFSNKDRMFSISPSVIRDLPLPPLCAIFPAAKNCSCQPRMLFRVGSVLLIDFLIHLCFVVIEPFSMYFATICAFSESVNASLRIFLKLGILIGWFLEPKKFDAND